jgi:signal transduction histidine kinase
MRATLFASVFLLAVALPASARAQAIAGSVKDPSGAAAKQVLILHDTSRTSELVVVSDREIPVILGSSSSDGIDYYAEFVDQKRSRQRDYQLAFRDFLFSKYKRKRFDLIIAMGDDALEFVNGTRFDLYPATPVVFFASGLSSERPANATGVLARLNLAGTVALALALQPDLRNIFVVNASDSQNDGYDAEARAQFGPFERRLAFTYLNDLNRANLEATLADLPERSAVYFLIYNRQGIADHFRPLDYVDRVAAIANAPTYSWVDSAMDHGIVGGSLKNQKAQVQAVAQLGLRVLRGEQADAIPLATVDLNANQVDWRELQRWGISEARVPAGTAMLFREPTVWDRYSNYVIAAFAALIAQSALIGGLLVQKRRRRRAEKQARESAVKLRSSYERIRDLGGRLLGAQEAERARIARELHDDVSQQLALLAFDLDLLRGESAMQRRHADRLVRGACDRAQGVARSVHALSHRLHPVRLQMLGLVGSLLGLTRDLSTPDLPIIFSYEAVPAGAPEEITLCLFRVVQEALQNALKHSAATRVSVHLSGNALRGLVLTIIDDGIGFDVDEAWACGLGLVSMTERVESVDGRLEISSNQNGTRLEIVVPLLSVSHRGAAMPVH